MYVHLYILFPHLILFPSYYGNLPMHFCVYIPYGILVQLTNAMLGLYVCGYDVSSTLLPSDTHCMWEEKLSSEQLVSVCGEQLRSGGLGLGRPFGHSTWGSAHPMSMYYNVIYMCIFPPISRVGVRYMYIANR